MVSQEIQKIIGKEILEYNVHNFFHSFSDDQKKLILKHISFDILTNKSLVDCIHLLDADLLKKISEKKFSALMTRLYDLGRVEEIKQSIEKYGSIRLAVPVVKSLVSRNPQLFCQLLEIDLKTLDHESALSLLMSGDRFLLEQIPLEKHGFSISERFDIAKSFDFDEHVLKKLQPQEFDAFDTREILIQSNDDIIDVLDISQLSAQNWRDVLLYKPELRTYVNINDFLESNIIDLIELCVAANSDYELILKRDMNEISGYGWEMLLISKPNMFLPHCNFQKLEYSNKSTILTQRPELKEYIDLD